MNDLNDWLADLAGRGIEVHSDGGRLNVRAPAGTLTPELRQQLTARKAEILALLRSEQTSPDGRTPGLATLGRLIGGASDEQEYRPPLIDPKAMARRLAVTFRPLPGAGIGEVTRQFRDELAEALKRQGVRVVPWQEATVEFGYRIPGLGSRAYRTRVVRASIDAVIDVERPVSTLRQLGIFAAEGVYSAYRRFRPGKTMSVSRVARLSSWAEDHAVRYIENPTSTQVIILSAFDPDFVDPDQPYSQKMSRGIQTLVRTFSEIVVGVGREQISLLNMNLSDAVFRRDEIDAFVLGSLIPKVFVPILPLPLSRFEIGRFLPEASEQARALVELGRGMADTGLLPPGARFTEVLSRRSHRDIVHLLVNGRTGVSYGFVAYAEPPRYRGPHQIGLEQWAACSPVPGFDAEELRADAAGRWYLRTDAGYLQVPDLWVASSRSGCDKTNLNLRSDVVRLGLVRGRLQLQLPEGVDPERVDIKPSYDVYVMLSLALAAALYAPPLIEKGMAIVHFHGYPAPDWFAPEEHWTGVRNPSVPCGTYESGIFNWLGLAELARRQGASLRLACLIEPDHGSNVLAADPAYLLERLHSGRRRGQIALGGKYLRALRERVSAPPALVVDREGTR